MGICILGIVGSAAFKALEMYISIIKYRVKLFNEEDRKYAKLRYLRFFTRISLGRSLQDRSIAVILPHLRRLYAFL